MGRPWRRLQDARQEFIQGRRGLDMAARLDALADEEVCAEINGPPCPGGVRDLDAELDPCRTDLGT